MINSLQADLKVVNDAKGGTVYRDHLPLLGSDGPRSGAQRISVSDQVRLLFVFSDLNPMISKRLR